MQECAAQPCIFPPSQGRAARGGGMEQCESSLSILAKKFFYALDFCGFFTEERPWEAELGLFKQGNLRYNGSKHQKERTQWIWNWRPG